MGLQFRLLSLFGDATPIVAVILAIVGGVLLFLSFTSARKE